jgi:preprotein translocase subunit YajC
MTPTAALIQETSQETPPAAPPTGDDSPGLFGGMGMLPLVLIFAIFWFVMIAPERKNRKKREEMLKAMKKGDKVMTSSGMYATVANIQEDVVTLQIADGVRARFNRSAVQAVVDEESVASDKKGD